jgi:hypothetical protein
MKPGAVRSADLRNVCQRIDRTAVYGTGRGDDEPRPHPVRPVALQSSGKRVHRHSVAFVRLDHPARRAGASGNVQRLVDAIMGEAGHVDRAAAVSVARLAGSDHGGEIGDAAAGGQSARGAFRIADDLREPAGDRIFEPDGAGACRGETRIFVRSGREQVPERGMEQSAAGYVRHEPRRGRREAGPLDTLPDIFENLGGVASSLRKFGIEAAREHVGPGAVGGRFGDRFEKRERMIERQGAEPRPLLRIRLQRPRCRLERSKL